MKFTIKTIGCKVNTYESNKLRNEIEKLGFEYIDVNDKDSYKDLDFYIVNTCSVTSVADKKSRQMLHLAKKYNNNIKVIAIGCMVDSLVGATSCEDQTIGATSCKAQQNGLTGIDYLLPNNKKDNLPELLMSLAAKPVYASDSIGSTSCRALPNPRIRAFIKIQDGCNQYCTYCIIPFLRGSIKSRDNSDIIKEVKEKVETGVKEIVLTGIHLSSFGLDRVGKSYESDGAIEIARDSLIKIMGEISAIDGVDRIRLGSLEPRIINDSFLSKLSVENNIDQTTVNLPKKFCANFCLSLQSGCDKTLKRMNRHYTTSDYEKSCNLIRKYLPDALITTDVIVGFPGETKEDFEESLNFVKRMRFYNPNIFQYSRRKGTKADLMDNQLTTNEKKERAKVMIAVCDKISKEIEEEYNKINHEILVEETFEKDGSLYATGYTKEYVKRVIKISKFNKNLIHIS